MRGSDIQSLRSIRFKKGHVPMYSCAPCGKKSRRPRVLFPKCCRGFSISFNSPQSELKSVDRCGKSRVAENMNFKDFTPLITPPPLQLKIWDRLSYSYISVYYSYAKARIDLILVMFWPQPEPWSYPKLKILLHLSPIRFVL